MTTPPAHADPLDWIPPELESVVLRLARADECAFKIGDLASKWSADGPLRFQQVRRGSEVQTILEAVRPAPPVLTLLFSEAVNHLRAAIDNVVWHLVEKEDGPLSGGPASRVNMPIRETEDAYERWATSRVKDGITALNPGAPLSRRIRQLQPYFDAKAQSRRWERSWPP